MHNLAPTAPFHFSSPPPRKMKGHGGGVGEGRAYSRAGRSSERKKKAKATTHVARAKSGLGAKMSSSRFVDMHKSRDKVGFALVFFGGGQRKPMRFGHSARFARVEGEVRKIQKPKIFGGGFFGGKSKCRMQMPQSIQSGVLVPPTHTRTRLSIPRRF